MSRTTLVKAPRIDIYRQSTGATLCACQTGPGNPRQDAHTCGCMVCGAALGYLESPCDIACHYCGRIIPANAQCVRGHFVCDRCHSSDAVEVITQICLHARERDAVALMQIIRSHPRFGMHGPEHHALVPAVILAALRNHGHTVPEGRIITAIQRGQSIPGGACAFLGACGAAVGAGIAVSILLEATPYDGSKRQAAQQATQGALARIASYEAPRCCQRDSWLALQETSRFLWKHLGMVLKVDHVISCDQVSRNAECIQDRCPLWPRGSRESA